MVEIALSCKFFFLQDMLVPGSCKSCAVVLLSVMETYTGSLGCGSLDSIRCDTNEMIMLASKSYFQDYFIRTNFENPFYFLLAHLAVDS